MRLKMFMSEKIERFEMVGSDYFSVKSFSGKQKKIKEKISGAHVIVLKDWAND